MGVAWHDARKLDHQSRSWFFGHLIAACGQWKKPPKLRKLIEDLNAPFEERKYTIASKEDALEYEERFGVGLIPEGNDAIQ